MYIRIYTYVYVVYLLQVLNMKIIEKQNAIKLRSQGMSIKDIAKKLVVAQSSVSVWVRDVVLTSKQLKELSTKGISKSLIERRRSTRLENESFKKKAIMAEASKDFKYVSKSELRLIGLALYWGEGGKTNHGVARISNSDPFVIKVMMRFFREICLVEESKFRGHIHTYSHLSATQALKYWSETSGIPKNQFYKTYIKQSIASQNKMDKLPYGTFDIYVCDTKLFFKIIGQIEKLKSILVKP